MSNRLKNQTSPYLHQHSENPVEWYPWCDEAFEEAKKQDKPIFLSIGYSTCHWCHVMAHESFENKETADILNKNFISIKVDREERPDIDSVYMSVCQGFTGSGGWPMSIFMTWDKKPFFAGTYFPVHSQFNTPGFSDLLESISDHWNRNRSDILDSSEQVIEHLKKNNTDKLNTDSHDITEMAVRLFKRSFDRKYGGFGSAPKFPTPHNLLFLMLYANRNNDDMSMEMAEKTLVQMRRGGIFDHIGYGFSRYSTDRYFLAPHFEKMLYDNALLIIAYSAAYSQTKNKFYLDTAQKTAEYVLREMVSPDGGFYSAQDADSEGVEGKFYTFTPDEVTDVLGKESGKKFAEAFDITSGGNFDGVSIPNLLKNNSPDTDMGEEKQKLYDYRKKRSTLHLDDKILVSWNSLMISALSMLYRVSREEKYLDAAKKSQGFIENNLISEGKIYTSFSDNKISKNGFLDDYSFYTAALIELYNSTMDSSYLEKALYFCMETVKHFSDSKNGGFYLSKVSENELFINPKETYDGAIPSGNSVMAYNLVRLYQLTQNEQLKELIEKQFEFMSLEAQDYPSGNSMFLIAKIISEDPPEHIVAVIKNKSDISDVRSVLPFLANVSVTSENQEYKLINDRTTYYVCRNHVCLPPSDVLEI